MAEVRYGYRATWSAEDGGFVATCAEFPSLSWMACTQDEASQGLEELVQEVIADMAEQGEWVPQPSTGTP